MDDQLLAYCKLRSLPRPEQTAYGYVFVPVASYPGGVDSAIEGEKDAGTVCV